MDKNKAVGEYHIFLQETTEQLRLFLEKHLRVQSKDDWKRKVLDNLTLSQQRNLSDYKNTKLGDLDLAQKLRVFDKNWVEVRGSAKLGNRARNYLKEMQTIRNDWSHLTSGGVTEDQLKRDLSTLWRFLDCIAASNELVDRVKECERDIWFEGLRSYSSAVTNVASTLTNVTHDNTGQFNLGQAYTRAQIQNRVGGGLQAALPTKDNRVCACCVDRVKNPDAPGIILIGGGPRVMAAVDMWLKQSEPVPVFLKHRKNEWFYEGMFAIDGQIDDPRTVKTYTDKAKRNDEVARVLFLRKL